MIAYRQVAITAVLVSLAVLAAAFVALSYLSFHYPIKRDRYHHGFSQRVADRAAAYAFLLRSPWRTENAGMTVESIQQLAREIGEQHGVDPCLVNAVATFESMLNPNTITTTGAMGLMALQPETAKALGVRDPFDARENVDGGTRLLDALLDEFAGDTMLALAAYNAGSAAVRKYGGVPPYRETQDYVRHVGGIYALCKAQPQSFYAPDAREAAATVR